MLRWTRPGTVWAMDFATPPSPIDGVYPVTLLVRDLASGEQLMALPCPEATARVVQDALAALFLEHGAPLVIKMDNDTAFHANETSAFFGDQHVVVLFSPPHWPQYNGSIEAGVGSMKTRAHHESARHGRPGEWTCDDMEAARLQANETARPHGRKGPTPDEPWATRTAPSDPERTGFLLCVADHWTAEYDILGLLPGVRPDAKQLATIMRTAVVRALLEKRLLEIGRTRITPLFLRAKTARIT